MLELRAMREAEICELYQSALRRDFPPSELKSLSAILTMYRRNTYEVLGAYQKGLLIAYALVYRPGESRFALLDYLAVVPEYRKQGIGTMLLKQLRSYYQSADALMIECERPKSAPDEEEARKRIQFYTHAGAKLTDVRIWLFQVEYSILVLPCKQDAPECDWAQQMLSMYKQMLPEDLYDSNVRLIRG